MKLRRSMLFVPGANAAMVSTSFIYQPDTIMFDLEDSVALSEKDSARMLVAHALQHPLYREMETLVRVNPLDGHLTAADIAHPDALGYVNRLSAIAAAKWAAR